MPHTPGPLSLLPSRTLVNVKGPKGEQICQLSINDPNAEHLVACWNAIENIGGNPVAAPDMLKALEKIRAGCTHPWKVAKAAIDKIKSV